MLLLPCPFCGPRPEAEFTCLGEVLPTRPVEPNLVSDADWADFVVMRRNTRGVHRERWWHVRGCGSWLVLPRDTLTHAIGPVDDTPPEGHP